MLGVRHRLDLFTWACDKEGAGNGRDVPECEAQRKGCRLHQECRDKGDRQRHEQQCAESAYGQSDDSLVLCQCVNIHVFTCGGWGKQTVRRLAVTSWSNCSRRDVGASSSSTPTISLSFFHAPLMVLCLKELLREKKLFQSLQLPKWFSPFHFLISWIACDPTILISITINDTTT